MANQIVGAGDHEKYRDKIATVDKSGKRIWLYPKQPKGPFYSYRKLLSYLLLAVLFGLPFVKINEEPFVMLNIVKRDFILFGYHFPPQDFYLFVIAMLILILFIVLFTVIYGRLFCGWICPQTIFMEMVYRRIEYWIEGSHTQQKKLNKAPWTFQKLVKKTLKHAIFFAIAVLIANIFLAYIIGIDEVINIATAPISQHLQGFLIMILFSFTFYFVFAKMREQVCTTICPYGRLQGVMLDKNSLAVYYDFVRGEPRGKKSRKKQTNQETSEQDLGDCIDCKLCVQVCPTGIDIRDGIQLECVNCTACMDACDEVMEKIGREKKLIRLDSYNGIVERKHRFVNPRSIAYSIVLLLLIALESFLFVNRSEVEVLFLRTPGVMYQESEDGVISNLYNYQLINKTSKVLDLDFVVRDLPSAKIEFVGKKPKTKKNAETEGAVFLRIPKEDLPARKTKIVIEVFSGGKLIEETSTTFLGPFK